MSKDRSEVRLVFTENDFFIEIDSRPGHPEDMTSILYGIINGDVYRYIIHQLEEQVEEKKFSQKDFDTVIHSLQVALSLNDKGSKPIIKPSEVFSRGMNNDPKM